MRNGICAGEAEREAVRTLCDRVGVRRAAEALGVTRDSALRVAAGQPVRKGTLLVLRDGLRLLAERGAP